MSGARVGIGRAVALGVCLGLAMLLFSVAEASGAKYDVAQCGWHVGADADWGDSTGGAKFRPDAWCISPGSNSFDNVRMKSFTRGGQTISGTRFARWRWVAPPHGRITRVSGSWWHALHDGFQHRIGAGTWSGGFDPFAVAAHTDTTPRAFVAGFSSGVPAIEARLLCARGSSKWCSLDPGSWAGVRGLTFTVEDNTVPGAGIAGELTEGGWHRGRDGATIWGADTVSGLRYGETYVDGGQVAVTEYGCAMVALGGGWRGTRMRPCELAVSGKHYVSTEKFSDGSHSLYHCVVDFAGNRGCGKPFKLRIDNNPPGPPRKLTLAGGDGWRRANDFDFTWSNPSQGSASGIDGAHWRITGPLYDGGAKYTSKDDAESLSNQRVPRPGVYRLRVWLKDKAGNSSSSNGADATMRLDDVAPGVAFEPLKGEAAPQLPGTVRAEVSDEHSGPARGQIHYRRLGTRRWAELPAELKAGKAPGTAQLVAHVPGDLPPGTYAFRAEARDGAGNEAASTRRADGTEMALRKTPPPPVAAAQPARTATRPAARPKAKTRLFAKLRWRRRRGQRVTVPFGSGARLSGRLVNADGVGLAGRALRIVSRHSRGALTRRRVDRVRTGRHGGFRLPLAAGPSRRITVRFRGAPGLAGARRAGLRLRVRGRAVLHAGPRKLRTGGALRLWGRVRARGAAIPRRGKLVAVQYYEREARRWRPVLVTRSDHSGRFRARYRFRYVQGTARIRLRALALAEERWPYAPGPSRPLLVRVRG